jgi:hypothetical protein
MFTGSKHTSPRTIALLAAILSTAVAQPVSAQVSTVFDPVGDTVFPFNPPFQDFVFGQLTKTASGDFECLMEMAAPVPVAPPMPQQGQSEIWWFWIFDLDPTTFPQGYPWRGRGAQGTRPPEFIVYVSWDGTEFTGAAIDRRPLLTGGEAIITPVPFSINGTIVEAFLASELLGDVPPSFRWGPFTSDWSGPVGSSGFNFADYCESGGVFPPQPSQPGSAQISTVFDRVGDTVFENAPALQDIVSGQMMKTAASPCVRLLAPPERGQTRTSMANTRFICSAQVERVGRWDLGVRCGADSELGDASRHRKSGGSKAMADMPSR